jgi:hypothetical protein
MNKKDIIGALKYADIVEISEKYLTDGGEMQIKSPYYVVKKDKKNLTLSANYFSSTGKDLESENDKNIGNRQINIHNFLLDDTKTIKVLREVPNA